MKIKLVFEVDAINGDEKQDRLVSAFAYQLSTRSHVVFNPFDPSDVVGQIELGEVIEAEVLE